MPRMTEDEILRLACSYAEQDRESFVEAYSHIPNDPEARRAESFLKQLRAYRMKRWGLSSRDKLDGVKTVTIRGGRMRSEDS